MRWLFLFVLVLNLAYFGWETNRAQEDNRVSTSRPDVPAIVLLSELEQFRLEAEAEAEEKAALALAAQIAQTAEVAQLDRSTADDVKVVSVVEDVAQPDDQADRCYTLGPFRELDELRRFTRLIKDYVLNASFRSRDELDQSMFRVYLEANNDYDRAKALSNRLKKAKITDQYVVGEGPRKNSVSLGHFKLKEGAYAHAKSIIKKGFEAKVEPVFRNYKLYWLDYMIGAGKVIPESHFKSNLDNRVSRLDRPCS